MIDFVISECSTDPEDAAYNAWLSRVESGLGYALDSRTEAEAFSIYQGGYTVDEAITELNA